MPVVFPLFFLPSCLLPFQDDTVPGAQPLLSAFSFIPDTHSPLHSRDASFLLWAAARALPVCACRDAWMWISSSWQLLLLLGAAPLFSLCYSPPFSGTLGFANVPGPVSLATLLLLPFRSVSSSSVAGFFFLFYFFNFFFNSPLSSSSLPPLPFFFACDQ